MSSSSPRRPGSARLGAPLLAIALTALLLGALPAVASPQWRGFGAPLRAWARGHGPSRIPCPTGGCYGRAVTVAGHRLSRFIEVRTTDGPAHRVDGFVMELGNGTSLGTAKVAVRRLLPRDARTTGYWIARVHGSSCVLWNLRSRSLARWLAGTNARDPHGDIGVNLGTLTNAGSVYRPNDVSQASVRAEANARTATC